MAADGTKPTFHLSNECPLPRVEQTFVAEAVTAVPRLLAMA